MACVHNQAKIDVIEAEIKALEQDISNLNSNITKCTEIKTKHQAFYDKLECVNNNLKDNYVVAGQKYDGGCVEVRMSDTKSTISECDTIVSESTTQITTLESTIAILENSIKKLNGNCDLCSESSDDILNQ